MPYVVSTTLRVSNNPVCLSVLRNEDLKEMLESNKESLKLEAMKRVVGVSASWESTFLKSLTASRVCRLKLSYCLICSQLIAKGKNSSELFPAVVKNVASKNIEVRHP